MWLPKRDDVKRSGFQEILRGAAKTPPKVIPIKMVTARFAET
jgi:hypothetical protein